MQHIFNNLKLLSDLTPGYTISDTDKCIVKHGTWTTSMLRRYKGESRYSMLHFINNIMTEAVDYYINNGLPENICNCISDAIAGIYSLKETYKNDETFKGNIDTMVENIRIRIRFAQESNVLESTQKNAQEQSPDMDVEECEPTNL